MQKLTKELRSIYDLEIQLGNSVLRVDEPAGTKCPFAVVFARPLHFSEIRKALMLSSDIEIWKNTDAHYPREAGFYSQKTKQAIAGPY